MSLAFRFGMPCTILVQRKSFMWKQNLAHWLFILLYHAVFDSLTPLPCRIYAVTSAVKRASMLHASRPSRRNLQHQILCHRLFASLLLLRALDLRSTTELLRTVLALLACIVVLILVSLCCGGVFCHIRCCLLAFSILVARP